MAPKTLAPGVRFHPTDVELVKYYLQKKVTGKPICFDLIAEVDVYNFAPSELPDKSQLKSMDLEWFFFCPRVKKYANGARMNRATVSGYWKTTGRDRPIIYDDRTVGMIKTLIYHEGRASQGIRTDWVMHEYRLEDKNLADSGIVQDSFVICKIFLKSGPGPRRTQYIFSEDDWNDDNENISLGTFPMMGSSAQASQNLINPDCSAVTNQYYPGTISYDASVDLGPTTSVQSGKGNEDGLSLLELPCSTASFPSLVTVQKDVSILQHPHLLSRHISEVQKTCTDHMPVQSGMHWNNSLPMELPSDPIYSVSGFLNENNGVPPSTSHNEEAFRYSGDKNHGGMFQLNPTPLGCSDVYNGLGNLLDMDVFTENAGSFIELDDLNFPLENELHWSHRIMSDDTSTEVAHHHNELHSFNPADECGGSSCNYYLGDPLLLAGSSFEVEDVNTPPQDYGSGNACSGPLSTRKRSRGELGNSNQNLCTTELSVSLADRNH